MTANGKKVSEAEVHSTMNKQPERIDDGQQSLFGELEEQNDGDKKKWSHLWFGMPEFVQNDLEPFQSVTVHFLTKDDLSNFAKLLGQKIMPSTSSIYFPKLERLSFTHLFYGEES